MTVLIYFNPVLKYAGPPLISFTQCKNTTIDNEKLLSCVYKVFFFLTKISIQKESIFYYILYSIMLHIRKLSTGSTGSRRGILHVIIIKYYTEHNQNRQ